MNVACTAVIIDDSPMCITLLHKMLDLFTPVSVVATSLNAGEGESLIMKHCPTLLFLDIEMPGITGLDLMLKLQGNITWPMQVIIVTGNNGNAIASVRNQVFDVLEKPYHKDDFLLVMERYFTHKAKEKEESRFSNSFSNSF